MNKLLFNSFFYVYKTIYNCCFLFIKVYSQFFFLKFHYILYGGLLILFGVVNYHYAFAMDRFNGISQRDQRQDSQSSSSSSDEQEVQGASGVDRSKFASGVISNFSEEEEAYEYENRRRRKKKRKREQVIQQERRYQNIKTQCNQFFYYFKLKQKIKEIINYPSYVLAQRNWMEQTKSECLERLNNVSQEQQEKEKNIEERQQQLLRRQEAKQQSIRREQQDRLPRPSAEPRRPLGLYGRANLRESLVLRFQAIEEELRYLLGHYVFTEEEIQALGPMVNNIQMLFPRLQDSYSRAQKLYMQQVETRAIEKECLEKSKEDSEKASDTRRSTQHNLEVQFQNLLRRMSRFLSYREQIAIEEAIWSYTEAFNNAMVAYNDASHNNSPGNQSSFPFFLEQAMSQVESLTEILTRLDMEDQLCGEASEPFNQVEHYDVSWFGGNDLLDEYTGQAEPAKCLESAEGATGVESSEDMENQNSTDGAVCDTSSSQQTTQEGLLQQRYLLQGARPRQPPSGGASGSSLSFIPGFSFEGQVSSLQGMQCILCDVSEKVSTNLKELVLNVQKQYHESNDLQFTKNITPKKKKHGFSYSDDKNVEVQPISTISRSIPYNVFGGTNFYSENLEQKIRSSQTGFTAIPNNSWTIGLAYTHHQKQVQEYHGLQFWKARGSVNSQVEADGLSAILSWHPHQSGFTGHLASYYGWGQLKNIRFFTHAGEQVSSKGTSKIHLSGGLIQFGYRLPLSKRVAIIPYVEGVLSTIDWNPYKERTGLLTCKISSHKESYLEKNIALCCQWQISPSTQFQCWGVKTLGQSIVDAITSQPLRGSSFLYTVSVPGYKKDYIKTELGLSYSSKFIDSFLITLNGKIQFNNSNFHKQNAMVQLKYIYIH